MRVKDTRSPSAIMHAEGTRHASRGMSDNKKTSTSIPKSHTSFDDASCIKMAQRWKPVRYPSFVSLETRSYIQLQLDHWNVPCRMGQYVAETNTGSSRPFMHARTEMQCPWTDAKSWIDEHPNEQWSVRLQLDDDHRFFVPNLSFLESNDNPPSSMKLPIDIVRLSCGGWVVPAHFDCQWNFAICVEGERSFYFHPPSIDHPSTYRMRMRLREGDGVLIPPGWWHQVVNEDKQRSILANAYLNFLYESRLPPSCYENLYALYDSKWPGRAYEIDHGYDSDSSIPHSNGYSIAIEHGCHMYDDVWEKRSTWVWVVVWITIAMSILITIKIARKF